jgi:hypothetical protein
MVKHSSDSEDGKLWKKIARDRYSSLEEDFGFDPNMFQKIIHLGGQFAPKPGQKVSEYAAKIKLHVEFQTKKNYRVHIEGPKGPWYTHRSPLGCFMCEDLELYTVLNSVLDYLSKKYPKMVF